MDRQSNRHYLSVCVKNAWTNNYLTKSAIKYKYIIENNIHQIFFAVKKKLYSSSPQGSRKYQHGCGNGRSSASCSHTQLHV